MDKHYLVAWSSGTKRNARVLGFMRGLRGGSWQFVKEGLGHEVFMGFRGSRLSYGLFFLSKARERAFRGRLVLGFFVEEPLFRHPSSAAFPAQLLWLLRQRRSNATN